LDGKFFIAFGGTPMVLWPRLFPSLLAGLSLLTGFESLDAARILNAGSFCLTVGVAGYLFNKYFQSKVLVLAGMTAVLCSVSLLGASSVALTESLFSLLVVLFIIFLPKSFSGSLKSLFPLALLTALCCLQRYMGITVLFTGLIVLFSQLIRLPSVQKFKLALIYCFGACLPIALWILRNYLLTSTLTGPRSAGSSSAFTNLLATTYVVFNWFLPLNLLKPLSPIFLITTLVF
jgi:hypothetical protein